MNPEASGPWLRNQSDTESSTMGNLVDMGLVLGGVLAVAYGFSQIYNPLAWGWIGGWLMLFGFASNHARVKG